MKVGTTTFGFRYLLADPREAPPLEHVLDQTRALGLEALQVCENARPLELGPARWREVVRHSRGIGLDLHVGCMALDTGTLERNMALAQEIPRREVRIVLETPGGPKPTGGELERFLECAVPLLEHAHMTLVIENHFDVACRLLAELAARYSRERVAFCIDTANSLRNFESAFDVLARLGDRAAFYHFKDYRVTGTNVGFTVGGAPFGTGDLAAAELVRAVLERDPDPLVFLENWVPQTGDRATDIAADLDWLRQSLANLRRV